MSMGKVTEVRISAYQGGWMGGFQIDISKTYENGAETGYRLAGPKFNGSGTRVASVKLGRREINEIRKYLDVAESLLGDS